MEQAMQRFLFTSTTLLGGLSLAATACGGPRLARRDPVPLVPSVAIVGATLSPHQNLPAVPPRAAYSNSASVGSR